MINPFSCEDISSFPWLPWLTHQVAKTCLFPLGWPFESWRHVLFPLVNPFSYECLLLLD